MSKKVDLKQWDETRSPSKDEVKEARRRAGHTQQQAAMLLGSAYYYTWGRWEHGKAKLHPMAFAYYLHRTGQREIPFGDAK